MPLDNERNDKMAINTTMLLPITTDTQPLEQLSKMQPMKSMDSDRVQVTDLGKATFLDVFKGLYDNVVETNEQVDRDAIDLMLGNIDNLAAVQANIEKANIAVDLLVAVKNEVISAYNSIINMQI